jgi:hypothetical protein
MLHQQWHADITVCILGVLFVGAGAMVFDY